MSFKITGLDKLEKQLKDAQRAFQALDGKITTVHFDPHQPASILAAIGQMENAIEDYISEVKSGAFPAAEHTFVLSDAVIEKLY